MCGVIGTTLPQDASGGISLTEFGRLTSMVQKNGRRVSQPAVAAGGRGASSLDESFRQVPPRDPFHALRPIVRGYGMCLGCTHALLRNCLHCVRCCT